MKQKYTLDTRIVNKIKNELPDLEVDLMEENWLKMKDILSEEQNEQFFQSLKKNTKGIRRNKYVYFAVAASIVVLISLIYYLFTNSNQDNSIEHYSGTSAIDYLELSDGSRVWMNTDSKLIYPSKFRRKERSIQLAGEAYFEIQKDTERVFRIYTDALEIWVVGTCFNINSYTNNNTEVITVTSGKVGIRLIDSNVNTYCIVDKGESCMLEKKSGKLTVIPTFDKNYITWKTNIFEFRNARLEEVVSSVAEHFNKNFIILAPELADLKISATFSKMELESIINTISLTLKLNIKEENDTIIVSE